MLAATNEENLFANIIKASLLLLAFLTFIGFAFFSRHVGLGVIAGGTIALLNFVWMRNMLERIIFNAPANPERYAQFRFMLRLLIISALLYFIITSGTFSIVGVVTGLSIIVVNLIGLSFYLYLRIGG
jgi:hypothetical protein